MAVVEEEVMEGVMAEAMEEEAVVEMVVAITVSPERVAARRMQIAVANTSSADALVDLVGHAGVVLTAQHSHGDVVPRRIVVQV